jgi:hypothetical protein
MTDKIIQIELKQGATTEKFVGIVALTENGNVYKLQSNSWVLIVGSPELQEPLKEDKVCSSCEERC